MANVIEREQKFREAALVLAEDAVMMAVTLKKAISHKQYERAAQLAAKVQHTARDAKWLMQRQPKDST